MASSSSSSRKVPLLIFLVAAAAAVLLAPPAQAASPQEYCGDSLSGLMECRSFMFGGAAAPSPACCAAYEAAFDANPFCLCYVADGTFGRATGYDVNVSDALRIPAACGQADPPIELCTSKQPPVAVAARQPSLVIFFKSPPPTTTTSATNLQ
jgi:hypothetical protein